MFFLNLFYFLPFCLNLGIQTLRPNELFILGFDLYLFSFYHLPNEEFAIAYFADIATWHVDTLRKNPCFESAFGAVCQSTKLAVSSIFIWLVFFFAAIAKGILNWISNIVRATQFENWVVVIVLKTLDIFFAIGTVFHLNYKLLRSLDHLL